MTQLNMELIFVENAVYSKSHILIDISEKQLSFLKFGEISLIDLSTEWKAK